MCISDLLTFLESSVRKIAALEGIVSTTYVIVY